MKDDELRQHIIDELEFEPSIDAADIGVAVEAGVVTLSGHVESYAQKSTAERAVARISGVRAIAQEIEVRLPGSKRTADDQIAKRALDILAWSTSIPRDAIQVKVQNGWITLSGKVDWYYQKMNALNLVSMLSGVTGITSLIEIQPHVQPIDVRLSIESALKRSAETQAGAIRVEVQGNGVTLEGRVHSWHERSAAERAAWSVPGVGNVIDNIVVGS